MHNRTVRRAAAAVPPALLFCAHLTPAVSAASAPEAAEAAAAPSAIDRLAHLLVQGEPLLWMLPLALLIALAGISIIRPLLTPHDRTSRRFRKYARFLPDLPDEDSEDVSGEPPSEP